MKAKGFFGCGPLFCAGWRQLRGPLSVLHFTVAGACFDV